ncbi:MAG: BadF/BadG/BcrA/BcrD ATPase family protein [Actinomycetes bacterium]
MTKQPRVPVVVAIDGGGSKTDVAIVDVETGEVLGRHRGPGSSHHEIGLDLALTVLDESVQAAMAAAGSSPSDVIHAGCYLTALDLPQESVEMAARLRATSWGARSVTADNDVFALLRAGTESPNAVGVICGTGMNGIGIRADGEVARILALGHLSGDWGGGSGIAEDILWHAARAEDGRGEPTLLRDALLQWTGRNSIHDVIVDVHLGRLSAAQWWSKVPEVFALAAAGDAVAAELVRRQGSEIAVLAASLLTRLRLLDRDVPVVLGGGIAASNDPLILLAITSTLAEQAPRGIPVVSVEPPITGAIRLALASGRDLLS